MLGSVKLLCKLDNQLWQRSFAWPVIFCYGNVCLQSCYWSLDDSVLK